MKFLNTNLKAFGLDLSDLSVKAANLRKKRKALDLSCLDQALIPRGLIKQGKVRKEKELIEFLKSFLSEIRKESFKTNYVVASLPEEKSFLKIIKMPPMDPQKAKESVKFEIENYIPLSADQVYLDSQIVSSAERSKDHLELLVLAIPKEIVDSYLNVLKQSGFQPVALESESLAISRALIKKEKTKQSVLLVDLGATKTTFIAYSNSFPRFTYSIPVSSGGLTEAISKNLEVNEEKAERMKLKYGLKRKTDTQKKVFEALIPSLVDLSEQLKKYMDYYRTHGSPEKRGIQKVLLSGGGANLWGLTEFLSAQLKAEVKIGDPLVHFPSKSVKNLPNITPEKSLAYTAAIGLALRGVRENF